MIDQDLSSVWENLASYNTSGTSQVIHSIGKTAAQQLGSDYSNNVRSFEQES